MSGWLRKLLGRAPAPAQADASAQPFIINLFDDRIVVHRPDGQREEVEWQRLASVILRVSARAPWTGRAWLILPGEVGADGRQQGCVAPTDAMNCDALLDRLRALPGFDQARLAQAMRDADAGRTRDDAVCWERDKAAMTITPTTATTETSDSTATAAAATPLPGAMQARQGAAPCTPSQPSTPSATPRADAGGRTPDDSTAY